MPKLPLLTLLLLSSCVSSKDSISPRWLFMSDPVRSSAGEQGEWAKLQGFSESLLHIEINDSPISVVIGYSSAEPDHVKSEASVVVREYRAEARPSLGFSVSF